MSCLIMVITPKEPEPIKTCPCSHPSSCTTWERSSPTSQLNPKPLNPKTAEFCGFFSTRKLQVSSRQHRHVSKQYGKAKKLKITINAQWELILTGLFRRSCHCFLSVATGATVLYRRVVSKCTIEVLPCAERTSCAFGISGYENKHCTGPC